MAVYKLSLYPSGPVADDARQQVLDTLRQIGFIGERIEAPGEPRYLLGEQFLSQVTFLGCSPHIEVTPPAEVAEIPAAAEAGKFCHVTVTRLEQPRRRIDPTARPRCPACRKSVGLKALSVTDGPLECPKCGAANPVADWNWRNLAAEADLFVDVWGVFTSEAVPNDAVLQALAAGTGASWSYFYVKD